MDKAIGLNRRDEQEHQEGRDTADEGQNAAGDKAITLGSKYNILVPFKQADAEKICMEPLVYTMSLPGKNTVGKVIESLRAWLRIPDNSAVVLTNVMTMLMNSSLMLDDIEDGSQLRRGAPAAHVKYGLSQTINSTTYVIAKVISEVQTSLRPECAKVLSEELQTLTLGQALDLNWTFHQKCPSVHDYLVMIDNKTGGFFRLILRFMEIEANATPNEQLRHLITLLGRYYQIRDDYQNLASDEYTAKKGFCDDLSEGKFSFPLIHLLEYSPNASTLHDIIFDRRSGNKAEMSEETKSYIITQMNKVGSLQFTRGVLDSLFAAIWEAIERVEEIMGDNTAFKAVCTALKL
ncbi:isoprenoid synthase domain-containing protein [Aspergillus bertholletiae]|uniref:Isoprenoid synthase domain-containing protein n=1 Tax=Aspergillus bertholletiae TaxID=1226010 RepID=A0A5N7ARL4_9EURO|nr:isoprenoid synthase domain-containing protein [Aspergillus bertholletiae]